MDSSQYAAVDAGLCGLERENWRMDRVHINLGLFRLFAVHSANLICFVLTQTIPSNLGSLAVEAMGLLRPPIGSLCLLSRLLSSQDRVIGANSDKSAPTQLLRSKRTQN